jgi:cyanophycinase
MGALKRVLVAIAITGLASLGAMGLYLLVLWHGSGATRQTLVQYPGGAMVVCGGGAVPEEAYDCFLELAGGRRARLVVIPSYEPSAEDNAQLADVWRRRGVASVMVLHAASRSQCDDPDFVKPLVQATGVWLSGGLQTHLSERYVDTEVEGQLKALLGRDGVIGGSSAGAAAMTRVMIGGGLDEAVQGRGFDLLHGIVVDQHVLYRNRIQRLLGLLGAQPGLVGLGIDERAAVLVQRKGQLWKVLGHSYAIVCVPAGDKSPRIEILKSGDQTDIEILKHMPGSGAISNPAELDRILGAASEK